MPGVHNHQNACAAYAACRAVGLAPKVIEEGFQTFKGLPHRSQIVAEIEGVRYVNDSKATNVASAAMALAACDGSPEQASAAPPGGGASAGSGMPALQQVAKERGLTPDDLLAAAKTYLPSGRQDDYILFGSGDRRRRRG